MMKAALFAVASLPLAICLEDEYVSLLQTHANVIQAEDSGGCSVVVNHHTYFSTEITAGTEAQKLDVVVDTGSDELVVPSCSCSACKGKCLTQTIPSDTKMVTISYGSGNIQAAVMSGPVTVGSVHAEMQNSMLVMTKNELDLVGTFEGILALGPPHKGTPKLVRLPGGNGTLAEASPSNGGYFYTKSFLEEANINRFSLCFNRVSNGALRLGDSAQHGGTQLGSVGDLHWGLGLTGISAGSAGGDVIACKPGSGSGGSSTPCGVIPDSGTTLMMGPASQITALYAGLCRQWAPCKSASGSDSEESDSAEDAVVQAIFGDAVLASNFVKLVETCNNLGTLPPIFFQLTGSGGSSTTISIPGSAYVFRDSNQCIPAFDKLEYNTVKNGPVWILGMPLFMQYTVTYDVGVSPPSMSFVSGSCAGCGGSLVRGSTDDEAGLQWEISRETQTPRKPKLDLMQPL